MGLLVSVTSLPLSPRERSVPIVQKAGWAKGPVWTGVENLAATGIRFPDRPRQIYNKIFPFFHIFTQSLISALLFRNVWLAFGKTKYYGRAQLRCTVLL
jgi:hypothetical protein